MPGGPVTLTPLLPYSLYDLMRVELEERLETSVEVPTGIVPALRDLVFH